MTDGTNATNDVDLDAILRRQLGESTASQKTPPATFAEWVVDKLLRLACKDENLDAITFIFNRIHAAPPPAVETATLAPYAMARSVDVERAASLGPWEPHVVVVDPHD